MNTRSDSKISGDFPALAIVLCVFVLLCILSWQKWVSPFIDSGREMNAPLRVLTGQLLYRDIYFQFGPFPPYFNALLYKCFGIHLNTLYSAGIIGSLLLTILIFFLARKFVTATTAMLATVAVEALCIFKYGGHAIFPYTFGALYGTLFGTAALIFLITYVQHSRNYCLYASGLLGALALITKLEFGFATAAIVIILIFLSPSSQRAGIAARALPLMLIIPAVIYFIILMKVSAPVFLKECFFLPQYIPAEQFYFNSVKLGLDRPIQTIVESTGAILGILSIGAFIGIVTLHLTRSQTREKKRYLQRLYATLICSLAVLLPIIVHLKTAAELSPLRTLPLLCVLLIYLRWKCRQESECIPAILLAVYSLVVLARVLTRVPSGGAYGAFLVPVPLVLFIYMATEVYSKNFSQFARAPQHARVLMQISLALINIAVLIKVGGHFAIERSVKVQTDRGTIVVDESMGRVMNDALQFINRNTNPEETIAVFPEGSSLNFLANRRVPTRYEILIPGFVNAQSEEQTIQQLSSKKVRFILIVNRPTAEFGKTAFGVDYARHIGSWIESNYERERVFGRNATFDLKIGDRTFFIKCYKRNSDEAQRNHVSG